jgi:hypothetical protein
MKKKDSKRKTIDGNLLEVLDNSVELVVKTKVPGKWILKDTETGQVYQGTTRNKGMHWKLLDTKL